MNDRVFDVRVLERNLQKGLISRDEFDKFLAQLDDLEGDAETVQAEFVEGVLLKPSSEEEE